MNTVTIVLLIILGVLIIAAVVLYFLGKKAEKKQEENQQQMDAVAQTYSMLIIDKKKLRLKDSGLPEVVQAQAKGLVKLQKLPIVKAKVGPKIMSLICDDKIYDLIPIKKEVKATVSGIYITDVKGVRGAVLEAPPKKKKGLFNKNK